MCINYDINSAVCKYSKYRSFMEFNPEFVEPGEGESFRRVTNTQGYWVDTDHGRMIDTMSGNGSYIWGYSHPGLIDAINRQLHSVQFVRAKKSETADIIQSVNQDLMRLSGTTGITWAVSGSDGVEAGVEMAIQYWQSVDASRDRILAFSPSYHGCTALGKALRGKRPNDHVVLTPAPQWFTKKEHRISEIKCLNGLAQMLKANPSIGTVVMESIPWVEGIYTWSDEWWTKTRTLCDQHNVLLMIDDVFGGFGKVGPAVSHTAYGIQPDIIVLGKALTGGYVPLSCALSQDRVTQALSHSDWMHGHTWQPQMLGVACARWVLDNFDSHQVTKIHQRQCELFDRMQNQKLIQAYRGVGLTKELVLFRPVRKIDMEQAGLCNNQYASGQLLQIITPLIADDQYWQELEQRITTAVLPYAYWTKQDQLNGVLPATVI